jgi:hypothetical protein
MERREMRTEFWWGVLEERSYLEVLSVDSRIILKRIVNMTEWRELDSFGSE